MTAQARIGLTEPPTTAGRPTGGCRAPLVPDRVLALLLLPPILVILAVIWPVAMLAQGRPFLYGSERMKSPDQGFTLWKIRTMRPGDDKMPRVLGGDSAARVTPLGRWLRRTRLDELPQIFNVIAGDIRFVGPRPPLRRYVDAFPELYDRVLAQPPGITGLATVLLHAREERILARARTPDEADLLYRTHCLPWKVRLDLLYSARRSAGLDVLILRRTLGQALLGGGRRRSQHRAPVRNPHRRSTGNRLHPAAA